MDMETYDRWQCRLVYACFFLLATMMHLLVAMLTLGARTSCAWPPCHDSLAFEIWSAIWQAPLIVTPWFPLPIEEIEFVWTAPRIALMVVNSIAMVLLVTSSALAIRWVYRRFARRRAAEDLPTPRRGALE